VNAYRRGGPGGLWSLWDMLAALNPRFVDALGRLSVASWHLGEMFYSSGGNPNASGIPEAFRELAKARDACDVAISGIGLSPTLVAVWKSLWNACQSPETAYVQRPEIIAKTFHDALAVELSGTMFRIVPTTDVALYLEPIQWFEREGPIFKRFPKARADAEAAGKSCALGLWTAAVFHGLRVLEHGLRRLAKSAGVRSIAGEWQPLIRALEDQIKQKRAEHHNHPKGKTQRAINRDAKLIERYAEAAVYLRDVKDSCRNPTMHARFHYSEAKARLLLNSIRGFMASIAQ
jgi:hypothetical protein